MLGGALVGGATVLFGYSDTLQAFLIARAIAGIGAALVNSSFSSILAASFTDEDLSFVLGMFEAINGAAYSFGPAVGGFLYAAGGFQLPFLVIGILTAILAGL